MQEKRAHLWSKINSEMRDGFEAIGSVLVFMRQKFLDELAKIEFPGSKPVSEAATKVGAGYLSGPVFFVFEKVSTFVVTEEEEKKEEAAPAEEKSEEPKEKTEAETSGPAEVKEEVAAEAPPAEEKCEEPKVEVAPPAAAEAPKP